MSTLSVPLPRRRPRVAARLACAVLLAPGPALAAAAPPPAQDAAPAPSTIQVEQPWIRATAPHAPAAGGFLVVRNQGRDDVLLDVATPLAGRVEIHEMRTEGGMMRMRQLTRGLPVPAGGTVELRPGSYHLMLVAPTRPFVAGDTVPVTLHFRDAGAFEVTFPVLPLTATGPAH